MSMKKIENFKILFLFILILFPCSIWAQTASVKGVVLDADGLPMIGVSVVEKGTTNGTVTGLEGDFSLSAPTNSTLVFFYIGYKSIEQKATTDMRIVMHEDTQTLDELVVVGYGTQKKANLTGSVASIKAEDMAKSHQANATGTLIGRMPGIIAKQESAEPGRDASNITIRGIATFQGGTAPAYIIDGIERSSEDFARLDPNEIASVNILKDAASAAIFGMRGANGVIVVQTKRGSASKTQVTYSANLSIQTPTSLPKFANAADYAHNMNLYRGETVYTEDEIRKFADGSDPDKYPNTDWYALTLAKSAIQHQHNITVAGGNEKIKYFVNGGYINQNGLWKASGYNRFNLRSNIDASITSTTRLSVDVSGRREATDASNSSASSIFQELSRNTPVLVGIYQNGLLAKPSGPYPNIYANSIGETGYNKSISNTWLTRLELEQDIPFIEGLKVKGIIAYDKADWDTKVWSKSPNLYEYIDGEYQQAAKASPSLYVENNSNESVEYQMQLNYAKKIGKHDVSALLMALGKTNERKQINVFRSSFDSDILDYINAGNTTGQTLGGFEEKSGRLSYVGRINYVYDNKYLLEANLRRDASENFAPDNRWGTFYSFSAGWVISEEEFFAPLRDKIDFLKIRGSWGTLGNDNVGGTRFPYYNRFDIYTPSEWGYAGSGKPNNVGDYIFGDEITQGLAPGAIANPKVTWETSTKSNIALDLVLFGKLNMTVDYFYELRKDILAQRGAEIPGSFGGLLPLENIGSVRNQGIDGMISYNDKIGKVRYSIGANATYAKNKIIEMAEAAGTSDMLKQTGRAIGGYYGFKTAGIFQNQEEIDKAPKQEIVPNYTVKPGDIHYVDSNGDGKVNSDDRTYLGVGNMPELVYGINGAVSYKGFELSFLLQGAGLANVWVNRGMLYPYDNSGNLPEPMLKDSWSEQNRDARFPAIRESQHNFPQFIADTYLFDASYLRLKNLEIAYNIPESFLAKFRMRSARIYVAGQNLLTFTKVPQIDPENTHPEGWAYPLMTSFNMGLSISF